MNLVELAQRIKNHRIDQRLTLDQVASRTGLTRSWWSKVENFRITPSLQSLGQIAAALGVSVSDLVEGLDRKPQMAVIRKSERKVVERNPETSDILYESLAHVRPDRAMDPFLLTVPAGGQRKDALGHEGEEFLLVLSGKVQLEYNNEMLELEEGDSLYFDATTPHRLVNPFSTDTRVLCVFLQRTPGLRVSCL